MPSIIERLKKEKRERKCESPIEEAACRALDSFHIPYRVQEPIGPYFADIFILGVNVAIECDGREFHGDKEKDRKRDSFFLSKGVRTFRIEGYKLFHNPREAILNVIKEIEYGTSDGRELRKRVGTSSIEYYPFRKGYYDENGNSHYE